MRKLIIKLIAWLDIIIGTILSGTSLVVVITVLVNPTTYDSGIMEMLLMGLLFLVVLIFGVTYLLAGYYCLKTPGRKNAEVAASSVALALWGLSGQFFRELEVLQIGNLPSGIPGSVAGILFAYLVFVLIKRLVIKPEFKETAAWPGIG